MTRSRSRPEGVRWYSLPRPVTLRNREMKQVEFLRATGVTSTAAARTATTTTTTARRRRTTTRGPGPAGARHERRHAQQPLLSDRRAQIQLLRPRVQRKDVRVVVDLAVGGIGEDDVDLVHAPVVRAPHERVDELLADLAGVVVGRRVAEPAPLALDGTPRYERYSFVGYPLAGLIDVIDPTV